MNVSENSGRPSTLLVHEWLAPNGGSENVFRSLMSAIPGSDAYCLWNEAPEKFDRPIGESPLSSSVLRRSKALSLPAMPRVWAKMDLTGVSKVVASSHAFAHHAASHAARTGRSSYAYVHTPARYIWAPEVEARGRSVAARAFRSHFKRVDLAAIDARVNYAANSAYIRDRIARCWDVPAQVIYPPVDVERLQSVDSWRNTLVGAEADLLESLPEKGFVLGASRLVQYKRLELAIEAGESLGLPVIIAGAGPDEARLRECAQSSKTPVRFAGRVSDECLYALYQAAALFVFMPVEDFGIMPVEAMALGTPVLANTEGGAGESIGLLRGGATVQEGAHTGEVRSVAEHAVGINMTHAVSQAKVFSEARFADEVRNWSEETDYAAEESK